MAPIHLRISRLPSIRRSRSPLLAWNSSTATSRSADFRDGRRLAYVQHEVTSNVARLEIGGSRTPVYVTRGNQGFLEPNNQLNILRQTAMISIMIEPPA